MARIASGAGLSDDNASEHAGAGQVQSRSREDTPVHLDAAIRDLEGSEGTARVEPKAVGARSRAIARQSKRLEELAVGRGLILRPSPVRCHAFGKEHQVWFCGSFIMTSVGVIQIDLVLVQPEEELIPLIRPW
ncbi:MAG: hypothetical protein JNL97_10955 [Verrucomicrobiales bacterium]|nr:hypothetical protein [Verrucomicrobiales bacterium]